MTAFVRRESGCVYFFADARSHMAREIQERADVYLAFSDIRRQKYVSVHGSASIISDRKKIEELWAIPARVWWKDPGNPDVRLIEVNPKDAEYWDAPGNVVSSLLVALTLVKGTYPNAGEHRRVSFQ
jgi:general stress protein 26